jgi:CBS domain-containing protein
MRVQDVMRKRVATIGRSAAAEDAWNQMKSLKVRHLVVQEGSDVVGVVSERDLGPDERFRRERNVEDVMTPNAIEASPETSVREAANVMRGRTIGCLPVVDKGKLVGIITVSDLLTLIGRGIERPVGESKRWLLKARAPRTKAPIAHKHV